MHFKTDVKDKPCHCLNAYIDYRLIIAGTLAYYLQAKYKVLEGKWDLLDQVIRSYNDEKAKAQQLPYESEDEFKKRVIITQVNRIKKINEFEREKQYLKTKFLGKKE